MKSYTPRISYDVYFNLTLEDVMRLQKEKIYNLQYDYKCIYSFVEETHKEEVDVVQYDKHRTVIVTFYSVIILYSRVPLKQEHITNKLKEIPNCNLGRR